MSLSKRKVLAAASKGDFAKFLELVGNDTVFSSDECCEILMKIKRRGDFEHFILHLAPHMIRKDLETAFNWFVQMRYVIGCSVLMDNFGFTREQAFTEASYYKSQKILKMLEEKYDYTEKDAKKSNLEEKKDPVYEESEVVEQLSQSIAEGESEEFEELFLRVANTLSQKDIDGLLRETGNGEGNEFNEEDTEDPYNTFPRLLAPRASDEAKNDALCMYANMQYVSGIKILVENGADIHTRNDAVFKKARVWGYENLQNFLSSF